MYITKTESRRLLNRPLLGWQQMKGQIKEEKEIRRSKREKRERKREEKTQKKTR